MTSTLRFLRQYLRAVPGRVEAVETEYLRGDERLPATLYRPAGTRGPLPGWVVLHGLTVPGRAHASLDRFARALSAAGTVVFVPDIPEWRQLRVAPAVTVETITAAVRALEAMDVDIAERTGLMGFSFGATQALVAAADPRLADRLRALVAWGGYYDLHNLFRFGILGEHELDGRAYRREPDPYGRWIMGANYLTRIPGHEAEGDVAGALHRLACEAGLRGAPAWLPEYDSVKAELREEIAAAHRPVFDLFAPAAGEPLRRVDEARELARELADAALRTDPLLDPGPALPVVRDGVRTLVAHGYDDRLVPFTESLRLGKALAPGRLQGCEITALFAHSGGTTPGLGPLGTARETLRFVRMLRRLIGLL